MTMITGCRSLSPAPGLTAFSRLRIDVEKTDCDKLAGVKCNWWVGAMLNINARSSSPTNADYSSSNSSAKFFHPFFLAKSLNSSGASSTISLASCRPGSLCSKFGPT
jgi:hypothetical protein